MRIDSFHRWQWVKLGNLSRSPRSVVVEMHLHYQSKSDTSVIIFLLWRYIRCILQKDALDSPGGYISHSRVSTITHLKFRSVISSNNQTRIFPVTKGRLFHVGNRWIGHVGNGWHAKILAQCKYAPSRQHPWRNRRDSCETRAPTGHDTVQFLPVPPGSAEAILVVLSGRLDNRACLFLAWRWFTHGTALLRASGLMSHVSQWAQLQLILICSRPHRIIRWY